MFQVIVIPLLISTVLGHPSGRFILEPTIINGNDIDITEVPYQLMLTYNKQFQCGAVLISSKHVLTAAHCLYQDGFRSRHKVNIFAGVTKRSKMHEEGCMYGVKKYIIHGVYVLTQFAPDIAVIFPDREIEVNGLTVSPIPLAKHYYRPGYEALASGWGATDDRKTLPDNLQATYIKTSHCKGVFADSICSRGHPSGICRGDSGGPLVYKNTLIGIARAKVSINGKCESQHELYTSVYYYRGFIKKHTRL